MSNNFIFTSESVTSGHPDKLCDQVSDAIVDHFLNQDPDSRIVAECAVASGVMFISAHYASQARLDIPDIARHVIRNVGYTKEVFDADACTIMTSFMDHTATDYIPLDLDNMDSAAIDLIPGRQQVSVFGYACDQTPALMPLPIWLAHRLADRLDSSKVASKLPYLLPDGETQVGVEYRDGKPARIHSITLVATQAATDSVELEQLREDIRKQVVEPVFRKEKLG
ncbi:MAG: S-adenosylmethionine synthetase N-terminal domain-containing protein, partial [Thiohalobacterales bacterium]|nr:S-adenosylmethionine synthetase N-terminal domain-containing protein [Thiohalobacterales bacterium]